MVERLCRVACLLLAAVRAAGSLLLTTVGTAAASADKSPITVAFITSETGVAASETADAPVGFLARVALQNAEGGVNGHKIVPLVIDDQSSPTSVVSAVQDVISKGAIGIVSGSALFFLAAKYPSRQGYLSRVTS